MERQCCKSLIFIALKLYLAFLWGRDLILALIIHHKKDTALLKIHCGKQRAKYKTQDLSSFCHYIPFHVAIFYTEDSLKLVIDKEQQTQNLSKQLQINFKIPVSTLQKLP